MTKWDYRVNILGTKETEMMSEVCRAQFRLMLSHPSTLQRGVMTNKLGTHSYNNKQMASLTLIFFPKIYFVRANLSTNQIQINEPRQQQISAPYQVNISSPEFSLIFSFSSSFSCDDTDWWINGGRCKIYKNCWTKIHYKLWQESTKEWDVLFMAKALNNIFDEIDISIATMRDTKLSNHTHQQHFVNC